MKKIFIITASVLLVLLLFFGYRAFLFYKQINTTKNKRVQTEVKKEKTTYNVLLLGYGGGTHDGTYLTDSMMVVHIDLAKKKTAKISIPRDVWVKLPTKSGADFHEKINAVYCGVSACLCLHCANQCAIFNFSQSSKLLVE